MNYSSKLKFVSMDDDSSVTRFNLTVYGATLDVICCKPNQDVISSYRNGKVKFAAFVYLGVLFFLSKFADEGWMDAPFHASLYSQELAGVPHQFVDSQHYLALAITLTDVESEASYGNRIVTMSKDMSKHLVKIIQAQLAQPISQVDYDHRIQHVFAKFTPSQMARLASVRSSGGEADAAVNDNYMDKTIAKHAKQTEPKEFKSSSSNINNIEKCNNNMGWDVALFNADTSSTPLIYLYAYDYSTKWVWCGAITRDTFLKLVQFETNFSPSELNAHVATVIKTCTQNNELTKDVINLLAISIATYISKTKVYKMTMSGTTHCHFIVINYEHIMRIRPVALEGSPFQLNSVGDTMSDIQKILAFDKNNHPEWF